MSHSVIIGYPKGICGPKFTLTLNLVNFLNGLVHIPFLELSIINFRDINMRA